MLLTSAMSNRSSGRPQEEEKSVEGIPVMSSVVHHLFQMILIALSPMVDDLDGTTSARPRGARNRRPRVNRWPALVLGDGLRFSPPRVSPAFRVEYPLVTSNETTRPTSPGCLVYKPNNLTGHQASIVLVLVSAPPALMATFTASSIGSLKGTSIRSRPCS